MELAMDVATDLNTSSRVVLHRDPAGLLLILGQTFNKHADAKQTSPADSLQSVVFYVRMAGSDGRRPARTVTGLFTG
jgi:hypothetical protein